MSILIVGADHLGNIEQGLKGMGATRILHWRGRKKRTRARAFAKIPPAIDVVVVFSDYVSHSLAENVKGEAKRQGIPFVFSKRSWAHLSTRLKSLIS